jgi:hypothetical protein
MRWVRPDVDHHPLPTIVATWPSRTARSPGSSSAATPRVESPAPCAPLVQVRALRSDRGVVTVTGIDNRVVTETVEDSRLHVFEQRFELCGFCCPPKTPRVPWRTGQATRPVSTCQARCAARWGHRIRQPRASTRHRTPRAAQDPWIPGQRSRSRSCLARSRLDGALGVRQRFDPVAEHAKASRSSSNFSSAAIITTSRKGNADYAITALNIWRKSPSALGIDGCRWFLISAQWPQFGHNLATVTVNSRELL